MASYGDLEYGSTDAEESEASHICTPCYVDGKTLAAIGYCVNCKEDLCRKCYNCYLIPSVTRNHKLLDDKHVPCRSYKISKVKHVQDINIKARGDRKPCLPRSSVLLPGQKLVIADLNNSNVKLVDTRQNKLVSKLQMSSSPWALCQVTEEQVAVTLCEEQTIALVKTSPTLSLDRKFRVRGTCRGVGYCDEKLVVSFDSNKMEVLDMHGFVLDTISRDMKGKALFDYPHQLTVIRESKLIYVSNYNSDNVVCMTFNGTVVGRYKNKELKSPSQTGLFCSGSVFVCGLDSNNIHQITEDCKKIKVLLKNADDMVLPESVSYCGKEDKLYIGVQHNDNLKVFKVIRANF